MGSRLLLGIMLGGLSILLLPTLPSVLEGEASYLEMGIVVGIVAAISLLAIKLTRQKGEKSVENDNIQAASKSGSHGMLTTFLVRNLSKDVLRSGRPDNTLVVARNAQKYAVFAAIGIIPLILLLFMLADLEVQRIEQVKAEIEAFEAEVEDVELLSFEEQIERERNKPTLPRPFFSAMVPVLAMGLVAVPPTLLLYPKIQYTNLRKNRKTMVEEELPFFSLYSSIVQSVGTDLYSSFINVIGKNVFKAMENEALLLKRNVEFFARSPLEALEELGRNHDSMAFKNFLLGYTSIARSGGDLSRYLETRAQEHFELLKLRYTSYSRNVGYLVEALIVVLVIVPILVVVSAFILPGAMISQLIIISAIAVPAVTIVFAVILANIQPKMLNIIGLSDNKMLALVPSALVALIIFAFMGMEQWLALAIATIIPASISAYFTMQHKMQIELMESALPNFLRDVTEYRKIGFHEITSIIRISKENAYNTTFDRLLRTLSLLLEQGYTPTQIMKAIKIRSWFARVTFFTLAQIAESGGGNPAVLESITGFVSSVRITLKEAKSSISIYGLLAYAAPLLLAFTVVIINEMLGIIEPEALVGIGTDSFAQLIAITPLFNSTIKTFIVTSSIGTGILIGKALDGTFKSTSRVAIMCLLAIGALLITEQISFLEWMGF